jgi:spore germination protein
MVLGILAVIAGTVYINRDMSSPAKPKTTAADTGAKPTPNPNLKFSGWLPYWDDGSGFNTFTKEPSSFAEIHTFSYQATSATDITLQGSASHNTTVVAAIRKAKTPLIPTITENLDTTDFLALLNDPQAVTQHANAVCSLATDNNFAGVDIDYENFVLQLSTAAAPGVAPLFTSMLAQMATCLHAHHKKLEVAVLPRTGDPRYGYIENHLAVAAFDYGAIGKIADDIQPEAYDFSYPGSSPGSVDPIAWVTAVVKYTEAQVPPSKIQLGLPLYGYDWVTKGSAVTADVATNLATQHNVVPTRDAATQSLVFTYTGSDGNNHVVWYDDAQATQARENVARQYGLNGVAFWAIGDQQSGTWTAVTTNPSS